MEPRRATALAIEHVESSSPAAFKLTRSDGKSVPPVPIRSPYEFPVEGRPNSNLMRELHWYSIWSLTQANAPAGPDRCASLGASAAPGPSRNSQLRMVATSPQPMS